MGGGPDLDFCVPGWPYVAARTVLITLEAACVCAGSFCLWCSKADDPHAQVPTPPISLRSAPPPAAPHFHLCPPTHPIVARPTPRASPRPRPAQSTLERIEARRRADLLVSRARALAFALLQPLCVGAAAYLLYTSSWVASDELGAAPREVWASCAVVGAVALCTGLLGGGVTLHHRRDDQHASQPLRPGAIAAACAAAAQPLAKTALTTAAPPRLVQARLPRPPRPSPPPARPPLNMCPDTSPSS